MVTRSFFEENPAAMERTMRRLQVKEALFPPGSALDAFLSDDPATPIARRVKAELNAAIERAMAGGL